MLIVMRFMLHRFNIYTLCYMAMKNMQIRRFEFNCAKWMVGLGKYIPSIKRFWFTSRSFVWMCSSVYGASVCANIRKNEKTDYSRVINK